MSEWSFPHPDQTPDVNDGRPYTDTETRQAHRALFLRDTEATAFLLNTGNLLAVTAPAANTIRVNTGAAVVDGYVYLNDASVDLSVANASAGQTRRDRVVLRAEYTTTFRVRLAIKQGTSGAVPALTQTRGSTWEMALAWYDVNDAGAISNLTSEIADASYAHFGTRVSAAMLDAAAVATAALADGALSADAAGRAKLAAGFFNQATVTDKFAADSILPSRIADGAGSGLDADTLDGASSAAFAAASHNHDGSHITAGKVANARLNTGSGNGLDVDLIDGYHAADIISGGVLKGTIVMFYGTLGGSDGHRPIPPGGAANEEWHLCNGETVSGVATPNMTDRFPVAAGSAYVKGATGGAATNNLSHRHADGDYQVAISDVPNHDHGVAVSSSNLGPGTTPALTAVDVNPVVTTAGEILIFAVDGNSAYAGANDQENRPPYIGVYFIMKIA